MNHSVKSNRNASVKRTWIKPQKLIVLQDSPEVAGGKSRVYVTEFTYSDTVFFSPS